MTTRLTATTADLSGVKYSLIIYDREYEDETIFTFKTKKGGIILSHEGNKTDPFQRICPTKLEWTMFLKLPSYDEDTVTALQSFYDDISTSYEGRFYCTLRENILGGKILFRGKILPDIGELILSPAREVKLTAIDGLSTLRDVDYRPDDYSDLVGEDAIKTYSFNSHFWQILMKSDVNKFFFEDFSLNAVGDVLFTTAANWTESKSEAGDIWQQVRKRNTYFKTISKSYRKYEKCYKALEDLLTGFNARIIFSDGVYHVEQIGYLDNPTLTRYKYDYEGNADGSYANKTLVNITTNDNIQILKTPSKKTLAPFKAVELIQSKQFTNYINGLKVSSDVNPGVHDFGTVLATGYKLITQFLFNFYDRGTLPASPTIGIYHEIVIKFQIKIGSYYLKLEDSTFVRPDLSTIFAPIKEAEWNASASEVIFTTGYNALAVQTLADYELENKQFFERITSNYWVIESLEAIGDGTFTLELTDITYTVGGTPVDLEVELKPSSRLILASGYNDLFEVPEEISIFEIGDIRNTVVYELKFDYFDHSTRAFKQLLIKNSTYVTTDEFTVEWTDPDMGETLPIQHLCMKQVLGMRAKPAEVLSFNLINKGTTPLTYDMRFAFDGEMYIPLTLEHIIKSGEYKFTLYKVFKDYDGINIVDIDPPISDVPQFPIPGAAVTSNYGGGNGGLQFFQDFYDVADDYVSLAFNLSDNVNLTNEIEIKTKWAILIKGVKYRYLNGTLTNGTWKFDLANDRIYFFKGSGNVGHIEVFKYK